MYSFVFSLPDISSRSSHAVHARVSLSRSLRDAPLRPDSSLGELTAAVLRVFSGAGEIKSGEQASAVVLSLRGSLASSCVWESSVECGVVSGACLSA